MALLDALTGAILPVLAIAGTGFLLGWFRDVPVDPLATVTIYVLTPALVFSSLATSDLGGRAIAKVGAGVAAFTLLMIAVAAAATRLTGDPEGVRGAAMLTSTFPNAGNYGIPLAAFAFGSVGRSTAVLYVSAQAVFMYTVGVYLASRGEATSPIAALREVFRLPLVYAVAAAGGARLLDVVPAASSSLMQTVSLTGDAAIPVMLLVLGLQLADAAETTGLARVHTAVGLKLLIAPVVALGLAIALQFEAATVARVFVLECSMPTAVTTLLLTVEFSEDGGRAPAPTYASSAIFVTTLLSVVTLTVLVSLLQNGLV
ncbi:MAG: AEC family transporter [Halobacteriaceae archaeon]